MTFVFYMMARAAVLILGVSMVIWLLRLIGVD
jgi:hypothetical protein